MKKIFDIKFIYAFIFLQPVLDLFTSLMSRNINLPLTIGIVARSLFMAYMLIYTLVIYRPKEKIYKVFRVILNITLIYLIVFMGYNFATKELRFVIMEAKGVIKLFYFPIVLIGLFTFSKQQKIEISNKFLTYILMMYTGIIFIATVTGTYYRSYNDYIYSVGSIGWFFSANEIGSAIAILIPFTILNFIQNKINIVNILSVFLCILSCLYIGTKVPFLGFIGSVAMIFIYTIVQSIYNKLKNEDYKIKENYKKTIISLITMSLVFCILFYKSPIYKNIEFNYGPIIYKIMSNLKSSNNDSKSEKTKEETSTDIEEREEKEEHVIEGNPHVKDEKLLEAVLSNRKAFLEEVKKRYSNGKKFEKLIGIGHVIINIQDGINTSKTIELDYQDIVYRHGIIGSILYFIPVIMIMLKIAIYIIRKPRRLMDSDVFISLLSIILGLGIAGSSGHVLTAPGVSIYVIIPIIILYNKLAYGDDKNEDFSNNANI